MRWLLDRELRRGEPEIGLLPYLVDRSRNALDIGANKGVWSEGLRRLAPQVHAFEPNPKIFKELVRGAAENVTTHNLAASDQAGQVELHVPRTRRGWSNQGATLALSAVANRESQAVAVEAVRIDDLDLGPVGFAKIDVEGHELGVLSGMRETLRRFRPTLVMEIEEKHCAMSLADALGAVEAYGYHTFALIDGSLKPVDRHQIKARQNGQYVFNWVFFPSCATKEATRVRVA